MDYLQKGVAYLQIFRGSLVHVRCIGMPKAEWDIQIWPGIFYFGIGKKEDMTVIIYTDFHLQL